MDSTPRRWILKPLSPLLQPSDLRTFPGPIQGDVPDLNSAFFSSESSSSHSVVCTSQQDDGPADRGWKSDESQPSGPSSPSSSSSSHCGFYSFVEDPSSQEAELNEAWMVSPQRQAQLLTLREEEGFTLQTYTSTKKPESLFIESEEESQYRVDPENARVVGEEEEKQLRKEIIHSQAQKKNPMFKDQLHVLENLDLSRLPNQLVGGFSPVSSRPEPPKPAESETVNKEQINFKAVRQQFLELEQAQSMPVHKPLKFSAIHLNSSFQQDPNVFLSRQVETCDSVEVSDNTDQLKPSDQDEVYTVRKVTGIQIKDSLSRKSSEFDDVDSGLEELLVEVDGGSTSNGDMFSDDTQHENIGHKSTCESETPIEREIRLFQEREENLRRSRGLMPADRKKEIVEIKTKRLQSSLTPITVKDKTCLSSIIQQQRQKEIETNEEPQQQGGILGQHNQDVPQQPDGVNCKTDQMDVDRLAEEMPVSVSGETDVFLSPCCPHRHPEETELSIRQINSAFTSSTVRDSIVLGSRHLDKDPTTSSHPSSPALTLQHTLVQMMPQSWRENLESSGLQSRGQGAPDFIEKEIKEDLRREKELRESREKSSHQLLSSTPVVKQATKMAIGQFYPTAKTDKSVSLCSSSPCPPVRQSSFITAQPWTSSAPAPHSFSSSPVVAPSELLQNFEDRRVKLKLEESSYAGIQPIDAVNNEVVESTRVILHKNKRALRWEAGIFMNQKDQQD